MRKGDVQTIRRELGRKIAGRAWRGARLGTAAASVVTEQLSQLFPRARDPPREEVSTGVFAHG